MALAPKKGAIETSTIIEILLIVIAAGIVIGAFSMAAGKADDATSENLCRGFNALRFGSQLEAGGARINLAPRACTTIDKKDVPSKDYQSITDSKEATSAEIRDLMARCWWMWLEGYQQNMFESKVYNLENGCFICYTFLLGQKTGSFGYEQFSASLANPYYAVDSSHKCSSKGGMCRSQCQEDEEQVASGKCASSESKCCISDNPKNECENRGGNCQDGPDTQTGFTEYYKHWQCGYGACYIKKEKMATYYDYIQGTGGVSGGAGKVLFLNDGGFEPGTKYAITFVSPGPSFSWDTLKKGGGAAAIAGGAGWFLTIVPTGVGNIIGVGALALSSYLAIDAADSGTYDLNYIMVSKYDSVKNQCAADLGEGE